VLGIAKVKSFLIIPNFLWKEYWQQTEKMELPINAINSPKSKDNLKP
jgi:hypothetical protein